MRPAAYYNEIDPFAAQWLRSLIAAGYIAPGEVDTRSIEDVRPNDIKGFTQCHFFAGIGIWSYALRQAGLGDDRPVWTGSCPCQPFSAAGKGAAFADERHLWPAFHHLIKECKPAIVLGEQVASKDADPWIDLVQDDMEALGYAFGAIPFPSASVGAPHIRDRLYWVANAASNGQQRRRESRALEEGRQPRPELAGQLPNGFEGHGVAVGMANSQDNGHKLAGQLSQPAGRHGAAHGESARGVANENKNGCRAQAVDALHDDEYHAQSRSLLPQGQPMPGPTNGYWRDADWLYCRDEKWRPVEPGTFPLAHGLPARMGSMPSGLSRLAELAGLDAASLKRAKAYRVGGLRGYGNAINAEAAGAFIECVMELKK